MTTSGCRRPELGVWPQYPQCQSYRLDCLWWWGVKNDDVESDSASGLEYREVPFAWWPLKKLSRYLPPVNLPPPSECLVVIPDADLLSLDKPLPGLRKRDARLQFRLKKYSILIKKFIAKFHQKGYSQKSNFLYWNIRCCVMPPLMQVRNLMDEEAKKDQGKPICLKCWLLVWVEALGRRIKVI